jgi:hypothetical protein
MLSGLPAYSAPCAKIPVNQKLRNKHNPKDITMQANILWSAKIKIDSKKARFSGRAFWLFDKNLP